MPRRHKPSAAPPGGDSGPREAEPPRRRSDAPQAGDDISGTRRSHADPHGQEAGPVHAEVTQFASPTQDARRVGSVGQELKALRLRAGLSAAELARAADMPETTYKTYEDRPSRRSPFLRLDVVQRLAPHLIGRGRPPITQQELLWLAGAGTVVDMIPSPLATDRRGKHSGHPHSNAMVESYAPPTAAIGRDIPILASRTAGWGVLSVNLTAPPIDYLRRPAALATNRAVWAITIADTSMVPRFDLGERIYCDPTRPPPIGGYAVLVLHPDDETGEQRALVGRLSAITDRDVEIETLSPPNRVSVPVEQIHTTARILTLAELLGG